MSTSTPTKMKKIQVMTPGQQASSKRPMSTSNLGISPSTPSHNRTTSDPTSKTSKQTAEMNPSMFSPGSARKWNMFADKKGTAGGEARKHVEEKRPVEDKGTPSIKSPARRLPQQWK
ncbi:hypothetical protein AC578_7609 [Pseudocercospora eumusae]|uniref:Uncharacterized protein n=1 Tax=Pseudocercospora eumusae TaxID=321146 RepID=A0A139GUZ4_9PEZI|nr:hypothetical protein AC578_7609 [Pseudocercospora eumusae]